jgi:hypothetical protein
MRPKVEAFLNQCRERLSDPNSRSSTTGHDATRAQPEPANAWNKGGALALAFVIGLVSRIPFVLVADFPLNDGGLFAAMIDDLQRSGGLLPHFTGYNLSSIPFAYPPLALYSGWLVCAVSGADSTTVLRWLPLLFSAATVPAVFLVGCRLFGCVSSGLWAGVLFAVIPRSFMWLIMGAGLTRGLGILFAILGLWEVLRLLRGSRTAIVSVGFLAGLAAMSHPEAVYFFTASCVVLWLSSPERLRGAARLVAAALLSVVVSCPWWGSILITHGMAPFLAASSTSGWAFEVPSTFMTWTFTQEGPLPIVAMLALLGMGVAVLSERKALLLWPFFVFIADPRAAATNASLPVALLASLAVDRLILPGLSRLAATRRSAPILSAEASTIAAAVLIATLPFLNLWRPIMEDVRGPWWVTAGEREAMGWIAAHRPRDESYVVVSGVPAWPRDAVSEWFPYLAERRSWTTVQGLEWVYGEFECARNRRRILYTVSTASELWVWTQNLEAGRVGLYFSSGALADPRFRTLVQDLVVMRDSELAFVNDEAVVLVPNDTMAGESRRPD